MASFSRVTETRSATDGAPELRAFHDQIFGEAEKDGGDIYGSPADWSKVKASGHYRRMKLLAELDLGQIETKVAVDFGTGPWGFACIFPKLRQARRCVGFDVSLKALEIAAVRDEDIKDKTVYKTSEGDEIPLQDASVDIFWGGEVIEHVRNPRLFLQEVARVCRDGGRVFLSTPNRDAVYYAGRDEDYAIGAEHIALMNYDEFDGILKLFCSNYRIIGYETSLSPELDLAAFNDEALELIQDRAAIFPRAASGFIVEATVSKSLYNSNKRDWRLDEFLWNHERVSGAREAEALTLFSSITGGSIDSGAPLSFETSGEIVILLFWAHAWSGEAEIEVGGAVRTVSLYSPNGGFRRVEFEFASDSQRRFVIKRVGRKLEASQHDQVIFYKAMSYQQK